ncbi:MAG: amidohydrolase family protein [Lachnospiraceae bacterium]|nr:amidohydrolase family protein [Lachnospiraceae bacterium]
MKIIEPKLLYTEKGFAPKQSVCIQNGRIADICDRAVARRLYPDARFEEWENMVMIPGTVNAHNHCFQSLLRGLSCDKPFLQWRDEALYKFSPAMTGEDIYNGALFAFSEMMKYGVTTVCDFFYLHNFGVESDEMVIKAAKDTGIRLVLARTMYDWGGAPAGYVESVNMASGNTIALHDKYENDEMVSVIPAPHSLHAATIEMLQEGHSLAKKFGCKYHIHVAEEPFEVEQVKKEFGGLTPIEVMDKYGLIDESIVIIHGVWLKESEIELLGSKGGNLVYCPSSNMFLADGVTDLPMMMRSGVRIGLGSDGACSNNRISIFEEMRMAALLQKAKTCDAMCMNYIDTFKMGTEKGAEILDLKAGKIEVGYAADLVGINMLDMSMQPVSEDYEQLLPNIVYSMQPSCVREVIVNGKAVVKGGELCNISENEVISKVRETMFRLQNKSF